MSERLTDEQIAMFRRRLILAEKSCGTIEKYLRDVRKLQHFLAGAPLSKQNILHFKDYVKERYALTTANSILTAVNSLLSFLKLAHLRVKSLRVDKRIFRNEERELKRTEYLRLLKTAQAAKNARLYYIMQTLAATGIRISELKFITVASLAKKAVLVRAKGRERTVLLAPKLCRALKKYASLQEICTGSIFVTKSGRAVDRSNIWAEMKKLCTKARVSPSKVFPHNFRHLFAVSFYEMSHDIVKLADLLGHASIDTTRIYLKESASAHYRQIERLNLII